MSASGLLGRSRLALAAGAIGCLVAATPAGAQCRPSTSSHEAKLLAFYSAPILFGTITTPEVQPAGSIRAGAEVTPIPTPDAALEATGDCFDARKNTRLASAFGRPRLTIGLPWGLAFEGSYLPPVTVGRAEPNLGSVALSAVRTLRGTALGGPLVLALRAHGTFGRVRGPITCARESLQQSDVGQPCYGDSPSDDAFHPTMYGGEAALGAWSAGRRLGVFVGGGATWLRPRFQVGFTSLNGAIDTTTVLVNLRRGSAFGGMTWRATPRLDASAQMHVVPGDAVTWHLAGSWRLR